jgi:hypothetical protein
VLRAATLILEGEGTRSRQLLDYFETCASGVSTKQKLPKSCDRDSFWTTLRLAPASIHKTKAAEIMCSRQLLDYFETRASEYP